jgi:hypothetical protein
MFVIDYAILGDVSVNKRVTIAVSDCIEADETLSLSLGDVNVFAGNALIFAAKSPDFPELNSAEWLLIDVPDLVIDSIRLHGLDLIDAVTFAKVEFIGLSSPSVSQTYEKFVT